MELKRTFRSGVVLIELMASILIFALAGAVCVRVLMKADTMSTQAQNLNDGVRYCSSAAEILRSAQTSEAAVESLRAAWPQAVQGEEVVIPFEQGTLQIAQSQENDLWNYRIQWMIGNEELYTLDLQRSFGEVNP